MSTYLPPNVSPVGHPSRRPLTGRRVLLLAALLLFVPPLGIAVLWWRRGSATVGRIIATVLAGIWSLIWLVAIISGPSQPAGPTTVRFANVVDTTPSRAATSPMSVTSSVPSPLPTTSVPAAPVVASPPPPATTAEVETSAPAQQPSTPIAPVHTAPAPVTTPPAATAPVAPPPSITVVPGAYCSDSEAGQTGFSDAGKRYVCTLYPSNGRYRWKPA